MQLTTNTPIGDIILFSGHHTYGLGYHEHMYYTTMEPVIKANSGLKGHLS